MIDYIQLNDKLLFIKISSKHLIRTYRLLVTLCLMIPITSLLLGC